MEKSYKMYGLKASPRPLLILVQKPKQPLQAKYPVKTYFEYRLSKSLKKVNFFFRAQSLSVDKVMKNKQGLELVTSHSSGYKTSSEKFIY